MFELITQAIRETYLYALHLDHELKKLKNFSMLIIIQTLKGIKKIKHYVISCQNQDGISLSQRQRDDLIETYWPKKDETLLWNALNRFYTNLYIHLYNTWIYICTHILRPVLLTLRWWMSSVDTMYSCVTSLWQSSTRKSPCRWAALLPTSSGQ